MKKLRQELLIELNENGLKNPLHSPIWILKYENIYHKGSFYLKVYLFENINITKLNEVQFEIKNENNNCLINIDTFNKAESYKNDSVLGCLVKLPIEFENKSFELLIRRLVIDNKVIQYNETDYGIYRLNEDQTEIKKNKYLSNTLKNYSIFPSHIEDDKWICSCGKVNSGNECNNCKNTIDDLNLLINEKLENLFIRKFTEKNPLKINNLISVDEVLKKYFDPLNEFGYTNKDYELFGIHIEELTKDIDKYNQKSKKKKVIFIVIVLVTALIITPTFFWFNNKLNNTNELNRIWTGKWVAQTGYTKHEQIYIDFRNSLVKICKKNICNDEAKVNIDISITNQISFKTNGITYTFKYHRKNYALLQYNDKDVFMAKISNHYNKKE